MKHERSVREVYESLSKEQKEVVNILISMSIQEAKVEMAKKYGILNQEIEEGEKQT